MQAISVSQKKHEYDVSMQTGRPSLHQRSDFGSRLHAAREALGLSQAQVAERLGLTQTAYALWERRTVSFRPDQIVTVAEVLQVPVEELFGLAAKRHGTGPTGRAKQLFERVAALPRVQQHKVLESMEALLAGHSAMKSKAS